MLKTIQEARSLQFCKEKIISWLRINYPEYEEQMKSRIYAVNVIFQKWEIWNEKSGDHKYLLFEFDVRYYTLRIYEYINFSQ